MRQSDLFIPPKRPWNAGRLIGPKAPLKPEHIWAIRQQLKVARKVRDLAMFNCALDSKLRACDLESFQNVTHRIPQQSQIFTSPRHSTFGRESYSITGMPLKIAAMGSQGRWLSFPARSHLGWTPSVVDAVVCGRATPAPALRRYNREETMPQLSIKGDENYGSVLPRRPKGGRW